MSDKKRKDRLRDMIFCERTTTARDFREHDLYSIKDPEKLVQPPKHVKKTERHDLKFMESLQDYTTDPVSFAVFIRPHPILGKNPNVIQQPFAKPVDEGRKEAQKSRPRLIVSPGMALDDIEDDEIRNLIISDTYQSDKMRADKIVVEGGVNKCRIKAPLGHTYALPRPIVLPKWGPPVAIKEFRMESRSWDWNNLRGHCDPTELFWLNKSSGHST